MKREKNKIVGYFKKLLIGLISGIADEAIRKIFRVISTENSNEKDDELLVKLVKEEIVRTAQSIKTPSGSIAAAARRAQRLVTELTATYITAIYKSKSVEEAKVNFSRFQNTVQKIVDFIKNGQFWSSSGRKDIKISKPCYEQVIK